MQPESWTVAEAKAKFSEVVERARSHGPQVITRKGRRTVVVVSVDEWERKAAKTGNLADFFAASPFREEALEIERRPDGPRPLDL